MSFSTEYNPFQQQTTNFYYNFEQLYFYNNCDIDTVINNFFVKYNNIKGDKEYITYEIKNIVKQDLSLLQKLGHTNIGKTSYIRHKVIPEHNNNEPYFIYCINTYIV
jgi:hypothetical protein